MNNFIDAVSGKFSLTDDFGIGPGTSENVVRSLVPRNMAAVLIDNPPYCSYVLQGEPHLDRLFTSTLFFKGGALNSLSCVFETLGEPARSRDRSVEEYTEKLQFQDHVLQNALGEPHMRVNHWREKYDDPRLAALASKVPLYIYSWGVVVSMWGGDDLGVAIEITYRRFDPDDVQRWRRLGEVPKLKRL